MSETALSEGSLIGGRYRLEHHLGEGGMGTVWSAMHTVTRRSVAMKFLKDSVRHRAELRQRFLREASAASALKHPNVVEILDVFDFADSSPVMVMELLRGETLGNKLARDERLSMEETAALMLPVVSAVGAAHALGIVHRDLKPENLFLEEGGERASVKVLDFGIAKLTAERYLDRGLSALLTDTGSMLGTPCYMAPEQASGESVADHRADVWSIGVILYECLSGTRPIEGENLAQVVSRLMSAGIIPLDRLAPQLPHDVTAMVMQMLSRDPSRRPGSLHEVSSVLGRYARARPPSFGAPSTGASPNPVISERTQESPRHNARVVAGQDADPRAPTLLSSPPVGSTVHVATATARPLRRLVTPVAIGAALTLLGLTWFSLSRTPDSSTRGKNEASATAPTPAAAPVTTVRPAMGPVTIGSSDSTTATAPTATAPTGSVPARTKVRVPLVTPAPRAKAPSVADVANAKPASNDETLFSGRK